LTVIKNEALGLRVPTFNLMPEMDTRFQQVGQFDIHNRFVKTPLGAGRNELPWTVITRFLFSGSVVKKRQS